MISNILYHLFRYFLLALVQVWVINNIELHGIFHPQIYPLFVLSLPLNTPPLAVLLIGFAAGLGVDLMMHTGALHASALLVTALLRPYILHLLRPAGGYQPEDRPTVSAMGFLWFFVYAAILLLVHHTWLFIIETLSFRQMFFVLGKILLSTLSALAIALMLQYLFFSRRKPLPV
ncbi:MAG: hypothetical protein NZL95_04695 [Chitinophagales bacterium]|nr:hypothetical protein [Chitinophagales bacterium]MDW8427831.1 hypothetical protein [Chitinophagales bacterium]